MVNKHILLSLVLITFGIMSKQNNDQSIKQLITQAELRREVIFEQYASQDKQAAKNAPITVCNRPTIDTIALDIDGHIAQGHILLRLAKEQIAQQSAHATKPQLLQALIANEEHIACLSKQLLENHKTYNDALSTRLFMYVGLIEVSYLTYKLGEYICNHQTLPRKSVGEDIKADAAWLGLAGTLAGLVIYAIKAKPTLSLEHSIPTSERIIAFAQARFDYLMRNKNSAAQSTTTQGDQYA